MRVVRRPHLLILALALMLVTPLVWIQQPALAAGPTATGTTVVASPERPSLGDSITLVATVVGRDLSDDDAPLGEVTFSVAPRSMDLWEADVRFGPESLVDGVAGVEVDLTEADLPFLDATTEGFYVAVRYEPDDVERFQPSETGAIHVELSAPEPWPQPIVTSTRVTGPETATVGAATALTASVSPASAVGTVRFSVDAAPAGSVPVSGGLASLPYTFDRGGAHLVRATFIPANPFGHLSSDDPDGLVASVQAAPTTTEVTGPLAARIAEPTTLTATVSPAAAAGTVRFSVGEVAVGHPVPVTGGVASLTHTFAGGGAATVRATFTPADPAVFAGSSDVAGLDVLVTPVPATVEVAGPEQATAGAEVSLTATVTPVGVPGRVAFVVDGRTVGTVPVADGAAVLLHRFLSIGDSKLSAVWRPADPDSYDAATAPVQVVSVVAGTTAAEFGTFLWVSLGSLTVDLSCDDARVPGSDPARALPTVYTWFFYFADLIFKMIRTYLDTLSLAYKAVFCPGAGRGARAASVQGTVDCQVTADGLACPFDLAGISEISLTGSIPVPADLAGQRVEIDSIFAAGDPEAGELTPLDSGPVTVRVPRRTVLSARLAPVDRDLASVERRSSVAYRIKVRNAGVVSAGRVRACVTVGKGATIRGVEHARVGHRRACWRLPKLTKKRTVTRAFTVIAPRKRGDLSVRAVVRPKRKSRADVVRLVTVVPVR